MVELTEVLLYHGIAIVVDFNSERRRTMKVTDALVKMFLQDQEMHGTRTALRNVLWLQASEQMHDLDDVDRVRTYGTKAKSRQASKAGRNGKSPGKGGKQKSLRQSRQSHEPSWPQR